MTWPRAPPAGTLRYTVYSVVKDNDDSGSYGAHRVTILGLGAPNGKGIRLDGRDQSGAAGTAGQGG